MIQRRFNSPRFSAIPLEHSRGFIHGLAVAVLLAGIAAGRADVILPKIIGDHMVLQRGMKAPIWGKASPGEKVSIQGDWQREPVGVIADKNGHWLTRIPTPAPGAPHNITIKGQNEIVLHDVLIGEVWICSGQSNMEMPVGYYSAIYRGVDHWQEELQHADLPEIRLLTVSNDFALSPRWDCNAKWVACNAETAKAFSAVGLFFGRELHKKLNVPIGLVDADFGGTVCEAWTSEQALRRIPDFTNAVDVLAQERGHSNEIAQANATKISEWAAQIETQSGSATNAALQLDDSAWRTAENLGRWTGDIQDYEGFITFRKTFDLPRDWENRDLELDLGPVDDRDFTYFNGAKIGETVGEELWSKPRVYEIPKALLHSGKNALTVCVLNTSGPGGIMGPVRLHPANETNLLALDHAWRFQIGTSYAALPHLVLPPRADVNSPSVLFNAMINPLVPFGIRGAIWYQGESNVGRAEQYRRLFPAMIADWRQHWGEGNFPFYYVQIAPFRYGNRGPGAALREAQLLSMKTPNTGMAVAMDSDSRKIHPENKQGVGHRLALWALAKTYGQSGLIYSGPLYKKMKIEGDKARIFFDYVGGGLTSNGKPVEHFTVAGKDGKFVPAHAEIDGDTIVVSNPEVKRPAAVRYAWADTDESSFGNKEGLPASSFRTDEPKGNATH